MPFFDIVDTNNIDNNQGFARRMIIVPFNSLLIESEYINTN
jgi:hypothetical protein